MASVFSFAGRWHRLMCSFPRGVSGYGADTSRHGAVDELQIFQHYARTVFVHARLSLASSVFAEWVPSLGNTALWRGLGGTAADQKAAL